MNWKFKIENKRTVSILCRNKEWIFGPLLPPLRIYLTCEIMYMYYFGKKTKTNKQNLPSVLISVCESDVTVAKCLSSSTPLAVSSVRWRGWCCLWSFLSLKHELLSLKVWNKIFTGLSTHLIDSYQMYWDFRVVTDYWESSGI